jgi:hypothetical protein
MSGVPITDEKAIAETIEQYNRGLLTGDVAMRRMIDLVRAQRPRPRIRPRTGARDAFNATTLHEWSMLMREGVTDALAADIEVSRHALLAALDRLDDLLKKGA